MEIRDQTARSVQSDLDQHFPQKLFVSSSVRKELSVIIYMILRELNRCVSVEEMYRLNSE